MDPNALLANLKQQAGRTGEDESALEAELARRETDAVRLYEPMPTQDDFHRSRAAIRIIRKGNRAGGTYAVCQEVSRAVRNLDPYDKYEHDRPMVVWMIVFEEDNIGRTLHRMLFEPGCGGEVWLIRDSQTQKMRAWDPNNPADVKRKKQRVMAPPMIPKEEIKGFSWVKKGPRIFKVCRLKNGSQIRTFCSGSEPPMGDAVDLVVIDEDLKQDRRIISELMARVATRGGRIVWAVWPKDKNEALQKLCREADDQEGMENPDVQQFRMKFSANRFISTEHKQQTMRLWATQGEEVMNSRDAGDFMLDSILMYPEFDMDTHGIPNVVDPRCNDEKQYWEPIDWLLQDRRIPPEWTRFMWIDPGWNPTAVLFLAVPPPHLGDYVIAYDELYLSGHTVAQCAEKIRQKTINQRFYLFGIDWHQARKHNQSSTKTYGQQFTEEFQKRGLVSHITGSGFRKGSDDVDGRIAMVHTWLGQRENAQPKFRVLRSKVADNKSACPYLCEEFVAYRRKPDGSPVKDRDHLMNALEYCAHDPRTRYHRLPGTGEVHDPVREEFNRWRKAIDGDGGDGINLGPNVQASRPAAYLR